MKLTKQEKEFAQLLQYGNDPVISAKAVGYSNRVAELYAKDISRRKDINEYIRSLSLEDSIDKNVIIRLLEIPVSISKRSSLSKKDIAVAKVLVSNLERCCRNMGMMADKTITDVLDSLYNYGFGGGLNASEFKLLKDDVIGKIHAMTNEETQLLGERLGGE